MIALVVFVSFWFVIPRLHYYYGLRMGWHDTGAVFNSMRSLFDYGIFYYQDIGIDHNAHHFNAFWFLLAPIVYFLNPMGYILLEAAPLIASVVAIYFYAKSKLKNGGLALMVGLAFAINPYTISINLAFHYEVWAVAGLAIYAMLFSQKKYKLSMLFFILTLSVKEDFWLYCILSQLVMFDFKLIKKHATFVTTALGYKILVLGFFWQSIYPNIKGPLTSVWNYPGVTNELGLLSYLATNIADTIQRITYNPSLDFMLSFGFVLLFAPLRFLWVLAVIFLWANSTNPMQKSFAFYYSYPHLILGFLVLPFALNNIAKIAAAGKKFNLLAFKIATIQELVAKIQIRNAAVCVILAINVLQFYNIPRGLRSGFHFNKLLDKPISERNYRVLGVIDEYLNGHSESVLVQFDLAAYVNYRKDLYCTYSKVDDFIAGAISPAWVLVDSTRSDQNVSDISTQSLLNHLRAHSSYKIVYQADDLFVFNKTIL